MDWKAEGIVSENLEREWELERAASIDEEIEIDDAILSVILLSWREDVDQKATLVQYL